ncbi:hypothetical protein DU469_25750 [Escherichia coli]|nr:hypothetical protein [Escherichia coli]
MFFPALARQHASGSPLSTSPFLWRCLVRLYGQQLCLGLYAGNAEISDTANLLILQHLNLYFLAWCCLFIDVIFCDGIINYLFIG